MFFYCGVAENKSRPGCTCDHCNHINAGFMEIRKKCPICKGSGFISNKQCERCYGVTQVSEWIPARSNYEQIELLREAV